MVCADFWAIFNDFQWTLVDVCWILVVESCCEAVEVTKVEPPWGAQRANQDRHALRPGFAVHSALFGAPLSCFEAVSVDS